MKFTIPLIIAAAAEASARATLEQRDGFQQVHLIFHGGPASYELTIPADGQSHPTYNDLSVNIIDTPDFNAYSQCKFETPDLVTLVQNLGDGNPPVQQLIVGPPQPILSVSCSGTCIPTYGDCYKDGQYVGACCAGYCAANKCRPWTKPSA
ncbi:hypothetical protein NKR23_g10242 [Pleurostoma richardsiae]|uniref:SSCRP protein n=1 Tax=Pleurostoma richardsiae TaxID=41990 RepID=A0AA38VEE7_9PEZI|nr:hypothetical protein NKR23_g10242 [Pleurostoma richardsiae]